MKISTDFNHIKEAIPLIGIGVMGAAVRSMHYRPFSWRMFTIRICTAGFMSSITLMLLSSSEYTRTVQGGICGIVGALGIELLEAIRIRMYKEIAGEHPDKAPTLPTGSEAVDNEADDDCDADSMD